MDLVRSFLCRVHAAELLTYYLAVGVPGELRGWEHLHKQYGKLPWPKLFEGAIKLARDGFAVNEDLAAELDNCGREPAPCTPAEQTDASFQPHTPS